jgi:hypothetical protein
VAAAQLTIGRVHRGRRRPSPERSAQRPRVLGHGLTVFALWNLSTVIGAVVGDTLGDPKQFGLDAAAPAAFLRAVVASTEVGGCPGCRRSRSSHRTGRGPARTCGIPVLVAAVAAVVAGLLPPRGPSGDPRGPPRPRKVKES